MRVITGSCRGKKLKTLESLDTRPTTDMVKEAVFSIIQFDVPASSVLDLFAGSGQMGIEALSRGASHCVFVDSNPEAIIVCEHEKELELGESYGRLKLHKRYKYGKTALTVYKIPMKEVDY